MTFNSKIQVVSEDYLRAMLFWVSGFSHRYWIERKSANYVTVAYSNPDEYGAEVPVLLRYPVVRAFDGSTLVVLMPGTATHGRNPDDREAAADMMADAIAGVPDLYRNPSSGEWAAKEEQA